MRSVATIILFTFTVAGIGCRPVGGPNSARSTTFDLLEKDFRFIPNTDARITFVRPLSDSRCPSDVECITEGLASIELRIDRPLRQTIFSLDGYVGPEGVGEGDPVVSKLVDGFRVSLLKLDPYPIDSLANNDLYRARLSING